MPAPSIGSRVMFPNRRGMTVYGTVKSINTKTLTVIECSDSSSRGWRVPPESVRPADSNDPGPAPAPAPAPKLDTTAADRAEISTSHGLKVGDTVTYPGSVWATGGLRSETVKGVVTAVAANGNKIEVYSATDVRDVRDVRNIDMIQDVAKAPKLTQSEAMAAFQRVYVALEPEVLCMDGEASRTHVARRRAELNRALHALTVAFGRKVDASEVWAAHAS